MEDRIGEYKEATNKPMSRKEKRKVAKINDKLISTLSSFYEKISTNQLSDSEIRDVFSHHNRAWCAICNSNKLNSDAKKIFALEVKQTWEKKKAKLENN